MRKVKITYNSPVVLSFALLCVVTLVISELTGGASNTLLFMTYRGSILNPLTWVRLFTHVLGHSSWEHLISNMMLFLVLGSMLEEKYGSKNILFVMSATAFITGFINAIICQNGLLGASGIVFAFIVLASMTSFKQGEIPLTLILVVILYIGKEVINGLYTHDNISQMAHIVGGLSGGTFGYYIGKSSGKVSEK